MLISAVIVNYDQREHTLRCVASVLDALASVDGPTEAILVDNASTDGTVEAVRERFPGVAVVASPENLGFAGGVAAGLRRASGEWALMLNNDATIAPGALSAMLAAGVADDRVGSVAAKIVFADGSERINSANEVWAPIYKDTAAGKFRIGTIYQSDSPSGGAGEFNPPPGMTVAGDWHSHPTPSDYQRYFSRGDFKTAHDAMA